MQSKKTVVITGGTSGIGKQTAITFAQNGFTVFITSRNTDIGKAAAEEIISISGNQDVYYILGNLSSIQECKDLIKKIETNVPVLDVLINNAGITTIEKEINTDGLEKSFMVNALAPYLITKGLVSSLAKSHNPRALNVSTGISFLKMAKFDVQKSPFGLDYSKGATYAGSKLGGAMLALNLADELKAKHITVNSFSPGVYKTKNSMQDMGSFFLNLVRNLIMRKSMSLDIAGEAPYFLATNQELKDITGSYFDMQKKSTFPSNVTNFKKREELKMKLFEWCRD
ncbi:SDR family NAD(P)-dependent oxidoreductase [Chondrinema litorale]|uniref:SDR family NAD(P)-dependent oxidoreductase n=1 Tax=Chondrinema litorale TaxID=2994555 RepID=UPI002542C5BF|nr:SDR family NAD(P)-dependent oxidoreductase [Chondrinema litorale]UZS00306.1 SDR family NAD(P)-dependent oxidoreductase [Chondrinema litorale]